MIPRALLPALRSALSSDRLRKEVGKTQKLYFLDLGVRNALLNAFQPLASRNDVGALWENLAVVERMKRNAYAGIDANYYFWRTYDRQEIDLIEESGASLSAFELKWGRSRTKVPALFSATYPHARVQVVTPEDAREFLLPPA